MSRTSVILNNVAMLRVNLQLLVQFQNGVKLNLRRTVSRPVHLGVGPPFGAHDQILYVL
jgi:hypothetical protein